MNCYEEGEGKELVKAESSGPRRTDLRKSIVCFARLAEILGCSEED